MSTALDTAILRQWIGREALASDAVTPRLLQQYHATFNLDGAAAGAAPTPMLHWCLAPLAVPAAALGPDGHPAQGSGFLPPVPLPRRMWAGGSLEFFDPLREGDKVERRSRITDVTVKEGRTGTLCFVAVEHHITTARGLAVRESQDIVYRPAQTGPMIAPPPAQLPAPRWQCEVQPDPVLLFRYSALTFNGHRIHYDRDYAMAVEGYPGLVVHGPLQATLLAALATSINGQPPRRFSFRGVAPLYDFNPFQLRATDTAEGLRLWTQTADGVQSMEAAAAW